MADLVRTDSSSSLKEFKSIDDEEAIENLSAEIRRLLPVIRESDRKDVAKNCDGFIKLFTKYLEERHSKIEWSKIEPPSGEMIKKYKTLPQADSALTVSNLNKLAVLKLNGGLGTSMGCVGPKSVISVRNDLTFLDLCVRQIEHLNMTHQVDVPLVLMNSFNTHDDTLKILRKYANKNVSVLTFNQSRYPRVLKESLLPLPTDNEDGSEWYPPGHGDLYKSIHECGLLDKLLSEGKEWLFVSNIDNLGAVVDLTILDHLCKSDCEFVMEVTDKTRADVKGGTLINYEGQVRLLEVAQVPKDHLEDFKSVTKFRVFNTNNLWINLKAIKRVMSGEDGGDGEMDMEVIENKKTLDGGRDIIQLEQAVGSAIKNFRNAIGINVPRSRFLPVKTTSDLLLVMSNLYTMRHGQLTMNDQRLFKTVPLVKLGANQFKKVKDFLRRFDTIPDILELDHLTVSGDVRFGKNVTLRGTVIIIANEGERIDIPAGSILENKIVSGNLRILDH